MTGRAPKLEGSGTVNKWTRHLAVHGSLFVPAAAAALACAGGCQGPFEGPSQRPSTQSGREIDRSNATIPTQQEMDDANQDAVPDPGASPGGST